MSQLKLFSTSSNVQINYVNELQIQHSNVICMKLGPDNTSFEVHTIGNEISVSNLNVSNLVVSNVSMDIDNIITDVSPVNNITCCNLNINGSLSNNHLLELGDTVEWIFSNETINTFDNLTIQSNLIILSNTYLFPGLSNDYYIQNFQDCAALLEATAYYSLSNGMLEFESNYIVNKMNGISNSFDYILLQLGDSYQIRLIDNELKFTTTISFDITYASIRYIFKNSGEGYFSEHMHQYVINETENIIQIGEYDISFDVPGYDSNIHDLFFAIDSNLTSVLKQDDIHWI